MSTPLGDKIRELRKAKGYTLAAARAIAYADYLIDTTETVKVEDATDAAFFRKYRKMDATIKDKIRRMVDLMGEDE